MGVTKIKHPNKGHTPNKGQKPMYQGVRYSESPLYINHFKALLITFITFSAHVSTNMLPPTTPPPGNGTFDCNYEGQIIANFTQFRIGALSRYEGVFEVCIGSVLGSVCDIGWNETACPGCLPIGPILIKLIVVAASTAALAS